jgi:hypothetical protein
MHRHDVFHPLWRVRLESRVRTTLGRAFYTCPMSERIGAQDALFAAGSDRERTLRDAQSESRLVQIAKGLNGHVPP